MRRTTITALLIAACASPGNHEIRVMVFEAIVPGPNGFQAASILGEHTIRVQIENQSPQEIVVHSIRVAPADMDLWTDDPSQSVEQSIGPGQSQSFDLYLNVSTNSRSQAASRQMLESISVDLSCTGSESGDFIAGGTYSVNHVNAGS